MKKVISIFFFLILFYIVPLSACLSLLLSKSVIFLATFCTILFATQPRLSIKESKEKKSTDANTIWLIVLVSGIGQIVSLIEWAYLHHAFASSLFQVTGVGLLIGGTAFRLYAIHILGKHFSAIVQIKQGHQLITSGPYKFLRHPAYTGAYIAMLGCAVFLQSFSGMLIFSVGMLYVYHLRIRTEEKTLLSQFEAEYEVYRRQTWKMFPMIW